MARSAILILPLLLPVLVPGTLFGQRIFDWPVRADVHPEALMTGGSSVFWNPAGTAPLPGSSREIWIAHLVGPDATGIRGVAAAVTASLPLGFSGGAGYWHLAVEDIPRTTTSPEGDGTTVEVAEDVAVLAVGREVGRSWSLGAGLRLERGAVEGHGHTEGSLDLGIYHRSGLPLSPRLGLVLHPGGSGARGEGGIEFSLPPLASARVPLHLGYGVQFGERGQAAAQRLSLRGSWKEELLVGAGLTYQGPSNGWSGLWMLGADIGRYSLAVLGEALANGFGTVHVYRAAFRFRP